MCSKFEDYQTKTAVAIVDDRYFGQTHRQTDRRILAMHWIDNKHITSTVND